MSLYRPLYDTENGGPPKAFVCQVDRCNQSNPAIECIPGHECLRVTRTERGMLSHLWLKHGLKRQQELFHEQAES